MSQTLHQSDANAPIQTLPPLHPTHDGPIRRERLGHIAIVLNEHACTPLDREIERIESLLASCHWRLQQKEVRQ